MREEILLNHLQQKRILLIWNHVADKYEAVTLNKITLKKYIPYVCNINAYYDEIPSYSKKYLRFTWFFFIFSA